MCIKIIRNDVEIEYDPEKPLEVQAANSTQIVIDYRPEDLSIGRFVNEVQRICQNGIDCNLNISVKTNNILKGAKLKRSMGVLEFDLKVNDLIKLLAVAQSDTDRRLEEMVNYCKGISCAKS